MIKVLVCGSRDWWPTELIDNALDYIAKDDDIIVIHGCSTGVDSQASRWAAANRVVEWRFPARWSVFGKAAGPVRNQQMLDYGQPDLVLALAKPTLATSRGTANMVSIARKAGIETRVVEWASL